MKRCSDLIVVAVLMLSMVVTPVLVTAQTPIERDLAVGSTGEDVAWLQETLADFGLFVGEVTGYFGEITKKAVTNFQVSNNLAAVGAVRALTRAVLDKFSPKEIAIANSEEAVNNYPDGYDDNGVAHAVNEEIAKANGKKVNVIVTLKLPYERYYDLSDSSATRAQKKSQFTNAKAAAVTAAGGRNATLKNDLPIINAVSMSVNENALNGLANNPNVEKIDIDGIVAMHIDKSVDVVKAPAVWERSDGTNSLTGVGTKIAIIDTGVDYTHPDLGGCLGVGCKVVGGYDFVNSDTDPMDDNGHGTHVAATAAGKGQIGSTRMYGVAPDAQILAYKALNAAGSGYDSAIIASINRAVDPNNDGNPSDHADVINMSLGMNCRGYYTSSCGPTDARSIAVDNASAAGVVSAISAGNSGPTSPSVGSPSTAKSSVSVAAGCSPHDSLAYKYCGTGSPIASFSSRGPVVVLGVDYQKPDVTAPGVMICAARSKTAYVGSAPCGDSDHVRLSGTSMAAPHVAGVLALMKQAYPTLTPSELKFLLKISATDLGVGYFEQGAGMVDAGDTISVFDGVSALPTTWQVETSPTNQMSQTVKSFEITSNDATPATLTIALSSPNSGITLTSNNPTITVSKGAPATFTGTIQVNNDTVRSDNYRAKITLTDASNQLRGVIPVFISVSPTFVVSPTLIDYGMADPLLSTWTSPSIPSTITNRRTDKAQTVSVMSEGNVPGVSFGVTPLSITVPPGSSGTVNSFVATENKDLPDQSFSGTLKFETLGQTTIIPTKFVKPTFYVGATVEVNVQDVPVYSRLSSVGTNRGIACQQPYGTTGTIIEAPGEDPRYWKVDFITGCDGWVADTYVFPGPTLTFTADRTVVTPGQSATLTWVAMHSTSCSTTGFDGGYDTRGSVTVTPTTNKTYTVKCVYGGLRSVEKSLTIGITDGTTPVPTVTLTANPTSTLQTSSTLSWTSTNATTCTGTNFTPSGINGSLDVSISKTTSYSITCTGPGGVSVPASVTVTKLLDNSTWKIGATVEATKDTVLRTKAGTSGKALCSMAPGTRGTIVGGPSSGQTPWWQLSIYQCVPGWVSQNDLKLPQSI